MRRRTTAALSAALLALAVASCTGDRATSPPAPGSRPSLATSDGCYQYLDIQTLINLLFPGYVPPIEERAGGASSGLHAEAMEYYSRLLAALVPPGEFEKPDYTAARAIAAEFIQFIERHHQTDPTPLLDPYGPDVCPTTDQGVALLIEGILRLVYPGDRVSLPDNFFDSDGAIVVIGADGGGLIRTPSEHSAVQFPSKALVPGTVVTLYQLAHYDPPFGPLPLPEGGEQFGPFYQIDVFPSQPMGPGVTWALCQEVESLAELGQLQIAKRRHTGGGVVIFPRVDPGNLVHCFNDPVEGQALGPARGGAAGSALRFASRMMGDVLSVFAPTPLYALHYGLGGQSTEATTDGGFSPWGAVRTKYDLDGFFAPVLNATDGVNTVKAGRTIPLKFSLGGDFGLGVIAGGQPTLTAFQCPNTVNPPIDPADPVPQSQLRFDSGSSHYTYLWKSESIYAGNCYTLTFTFTDGQALQAKFQFTP